MEFRNRDKSCCTLLSLAGHPHFLLLSSRYNLHNLAPKLPKRWDLPHGHFQSENQRGMEEPLVTRTRVHFDNGSGRYSTVIGFF